MKFILLPLLFLLFSCSCKTLDETKIAKAYPTYLYAPDTTAQLVLKFDTIGAAEFAACKKAYHLKLAENNRGVVRTDSSFYVLTKDSVFYFPADTNDYSKYGYYGGYYAATGMHAVIYVDGDNEIGMTYLIDKKTNLCWEIPSAFDDPCLPPLLSKHNNFFAAYANNGYADNESCIVVIAVNDKTSAPKLQVAKFYTTDQWQIKDLVWLDDDTFAVDVVTTIVNEETGERKQVENFLLADFK